MHELASEKPRVSSQEASVRVVINIIFKPKLHESTHEILIAHKCFCKITWPRSTLPDISAFLKPDLS